MWEAVDLEALLCIPKPGAGGVILGGKLKINAYHVFVQNTVE